MKIPMTQSVYLLILPCVMLLENEQKIKRLLQSARQEGSAYNGHFGKLEFSRQI